jgi:hypothetical protein
MQRWARDPARITIVDVSFAERADLPQVRAPAPADRTRRRLTGR